MYPILNKLNEIIYTTEDGERSYTGKDFIELAKGNVEYAERLLDRVSWQGVETMIDEDLRSNEIIEFKNQYLLTYGESWSMFNHDDIFNKEDFIERYYPKYHSCDEIARLDDLSKLTNLEHEPGDCADELLQTNYSGNASNPQIQFDLSRQKYYVLKRAIHNFLINN